MQTGHIFNLRSRTGNAESTPVRGVEEIGVQRDEYDWHEWRTKVLSGILVVLIVLLAVAVWLIYPTSRGQKKDAADILSLQTVTNSLGGRMGSAETNMGKMAAVFPALAQRMNQLESNLKTARDQAQAAATQAGQRIREDLKSIQSRVFSLESNQRESSERAIQLQQQVSDLQRQIATLREEASAATGKIKELDDAQLTSTRAFSGLNERVTTNQTALSTLVNHVDQKRIDFEVSSRQAKEVAPDIYLTLTHADTRKQEVDAMLKLGQDGGYVTIRGQGIRKSVLFHIPDERRPIELVFTQISKNGASGYLMMPALKTASQ